LETEIPLRETGAFASSATSINQRLGEQKAVEGETFFQKITLVIRLADVRIGT
jgi:hypothetical protein